MYCILDMLYEHMNTLWVMIVPFEVQLQNLVCACHFGAW